jgi:hypothetical protein
MWATIPFLITMIVALLTITYVPALTEVSASMSPYDPARSGRIQDLVAMVHTAIEERSVVRDVGLVTATCEPLPDKSGHQIHKLFNDCDGIKDEIARGGCQKVFFDVKDCRGKPDEKPCACKAIAGWIVNNLNAGDDASTQIVTVEEVPLPIKDKAGTPIVRKLADCATATDVESCRDLFVKVSNCQILAPADGNVERCQADARLTWMDGNQSELDPH